MLVVTSLMAEAFRFDPMQEWLFPNESIRARRLRRFYELDVRHRLNGQALAHLAGHVGVAFWHPPDSWTVSPLVAARIAPAFTSVLVHHPFRAQSVLREILKRHPTEPHWYLSHLAVASSERGRGIGRALLEAGLEEADRDGLGAYLETANPENLAFYRAAGFSQVGTVKMTGAPQVWLLWHAPG